MPKSREGYKYILLLVCSFSAWPEAFPLKTQTAEEVARILYSEIFCRYGAPKVIVTDRGRNFTSLLVQTLSELFHVKRALTSSFHPASNSAVERQNSALAQSIRIYCNQNQDDWPQILPGVLMALRATPATQSTEFSPFYLMYGKEMNTPLESLLKPPDSLPKSVEDYIENIQKNLELAQIAHDNRTQAQQKYTRLYDRTAAPPAFHIGDRVLLKWSRVKKGRSPKLTAKFVGPYYITDRVSSYTFKLRDCSTNKLHPSPVHANRLKLYHDPEDRPLRPRAPLPEPVHDENELPQNNSNTPEAQNVTPPPEQQQIVPDPDEWFEVEKLLKCKPIKGVKHYLVKWKGNYPPSWEPHSNVSQALIREFHVNRTLQGKPRKR
ncbi:protein NYNRIN-like [Lingula anatina]|uniref:Protein NYNRIN-like n=1 Tax=Lingula anatina TaxID=7574 RepID=A0A1S3J5I1_LINAN|nr:protein NYNRIN-like [Lingula anatina]|eukprot:XP_013405563.1 protein NYNRIN-like [Lingula anatina]